MTFGMLKDLERPGDVFRDLGPNWFASVMGTGIVAIAAATLPFRVPGLHVFALVVWALAAAWLLVLSAAWAVHWTRHTDRALAHADNPVMAQFWGCPAMALLTVGAGTLLVGRDWTGAAAAVDIDWVLWSLGTALGLVTACWIPYLMMTRHEIAPDGAFGGWLMPIVHRGTARPLRRRRAGAADLAARLLRDVRHLAVRVGHHHHAAVGTAGHV
jgi:tellurite resistance protein TehA-like permease